MEKAPQNDTLGQMPLMTLDEAIEQLVYNQHLARLSPEHGETLYDVQLRAGQHYKELVQRCDHQTLQLAYKVVHGY